MKEIQNLRHQYSTLQRRVQEKETQEHQNEHQHQSLKDKIVMLQTIIKGKDAEIALLKNERRERGGYL